MGIIECARRHASETYHGGEPLLFCGTTWVPLCGTAASSKEILKQTAGGLLVVGTFAFGGLASFAAGARVLIHGHYYDPVSGTSQQIVPPAILEYLRSAATEHHWQNPIAVLPSPVAAVALPGFRFIVIHPDFIGGKTWVWAGRADRIFVVVQETMIQDGRAGAVLKSFVNYDVSDRDQTHVEGMVIYSQ